MTTMEADTNEPVTLAELHLLHAKVQARFATALDLHGARYEVLGQRFDRVMHRRLRPDAEALAADLRALFDADDDRLRYAAQRGATEVGAKDAGGTMAYAELQSRHHSTRPKLSPLELVNRFRDRGILVSVGTDGNLRVAPASALDEADRAVLADYKPGILQALARDEVVL